MTLNIGVRWETDTPIVDARNRMNGFDPHQINPVSGTPGVVKFMGLNGFRTTPYDLDKNNFGPRFGFAWKPFGSTKLVVRGGYGIFYAHPFDSGQPNTAALGFSTSTALNSPDNGITAPFFLQDGVPPVTGHQRGARRYVRRGGRWARPQYRGDVLRGEPADWLLAAVQFRLAARTCRRNRWSR